MGEVLLDALLDSLKIFPFLFLLYVLIEFLEHRTSITNNKNLLRGGELFIQDRDGDLSLLMQDEKADGEKFYYGSSHGLLIEQFYRAVEQGGQKYIHLHDGFAVMQLMDAMLQSGDGKKMELSC